MNRTKQMFISLISLLFCCMGAWAEGELNGLFTINASGDKVQFSKGNLQYFCSTSAPEWRFAEHQYDYVAFDISAYAANSEKWIDLFAHGTSGYNNGQANYQPYVLGAASNTYYQDNLTGNADWGYNAISNGGNTENIGWRTLTRDEWLYVFSGRSNAASKYGHGSINGTNGMILLPDSWTLPDGLSFTSGNSAWTNSYTLEQWALMENAGAVFLPASGSANSQGIPPESTQNLNGFYRASTAAYYMYFRQGALQNCEMSFYQYGDAVRLVKDYQLQQDAEGNYLIGSAYDWKLFATLVQTTPTANAKMTADIDLGTQITMIASDFDHPYQGTFDGQGHTLTVNWTTDGEDRIAPFRYAEGATIKRLHVDGSISKTDAEGRCPAGILACSIGNATTTITECWSSVSLSAFDTIGGLFCVACGNSTTNIIDCVFSGMISASNSWGHSGGFVSHADKTYLYNTQGAPTVNVTRGLNLGTFTGGITEAYTFIRADANSVYGTHTVNSCYYKNVYGHAQGTQATAEELADGTTTTALNTGRTGDEAVWVKYPVTNQPMLKVFATEEEPDGNQLQQDAEGNYLLSTAQDMRDFAALVNGGNNTANAKVMNDIDLAGDDDNQWTPIGTNSNWYNGTFDGQGYTIKNLYWHSTVNGVVGLFAYADGATIKNIRVEGDMDNNSNSTTTGEQHTGGIVGYSRNSTLIINCSFAGTAKFLYDGGGIVGLGNSHIINCYNEGTISFPSKTNYAGGGILGYTRDGATIVNCYNTGSIISTLNSTGYIYPIGGGTLNSCYYRESCVKNGQNAGWSNGYGGGTAMSADDMKSAAFVATLNENVAALKSAYPDISEWVQDPVTNLPMLKIFATEQEPDEMFCYIYDHEAKTATVTYLSDSDNNKKGGTYVGDVVIPAKAPNGYDVTVIGENAFYNCPEMTSLTIPATIDSIGCEPFAGSEAQLTKITIEDGDTPIRCHVRDAYPMGCYPVFGRYVDVEELYIGRNYSSFVNRGWAEAVYEGSWSLIKDSEHLKKVTLGNVFTEVPYAMFYGCTQLQEVNISPNAKSVGKEAFSHCGSLTAIDLPDGIETIDEEAFYYCTALEQIGLPETLKVIGGNAFTNCDAFSSFTIPASVDSIGANILADCDNLKRIDIAYSPEPLKYCCPSQFQNSLRSAPIDTLYTDRYIDGALSDNRTLKKLYIGPNVTALHDYNFSDCYNIDEVYSLNPVPPTCEGSSVFYSGIKQNGTLHVPAGSLDAYKEAYIWNDFITTIDDIKGDEPVEPTLTQKKLLATSLANMNTARISHQIMPVDDGFVVFGGHTTGFARTQTAERYNISTDSWTQMNMLYCQDYAAGIVTADGKMLLAGGMSGNGGSGASNQCELYDPADNTFTATGSMTQARSMATATMTKSGKIYVNGCWYNSSYDLECYDPGTGTFSKVGNGLKTYHPLLLPLRGERVAIASESTMAVVENGTTTNVQSDLLTEFPILKGWDEMQMKYYQLADYSHIVVGKSGSQAVLLNIYDDAKEGVKVTKIADLPMTLPNNESIGIAYQDQVTRVFCNNNKRKVYVQTTLVNDRFSPVIIEYQYPSASKLEGGSTVVYTTDKPLAKQIDNAAWMMLVDGTLVSAGGGDNNSAPHNISYIYKLGGIRGDVNGDGKVDMGDVIFITNIILGTEAATEAADVNNDGTVGMPDVMFIVNKIQKDKYPDE